VRELGCIMIIRFPASQFLHKRLVCSLVKTGGSRFHASSTSISSQVLSYQCSCKVIFSEQGRCLHGHLMQRKQDRFNLIQYMFEAPYKDILGCQKIVNILDCKKSVDVLDSQNSVNILDCKKSVDILDCKNSLVTKKSRRALTPWQLQDHLGLHISSS
jgi:hypothetical protein